MTGKRGFTWTLLGLCAVAALVAFGYPMYVIRPFRAQGASELAAALMVRGWAPAIGTSAGVIALLAAFVLWRDGRRNERIAAASVACLTLASAALVHVNVYELMFHRIDSTGSSTPAEAKIDGEDMVLAVRAGGQSRAYPIRMMGYHHIANDIVGGLPIAATY